MGDEADILVFYDGTTEEMTNYIKGFLLLGYLALAVYSVWSVTLCVLVCCGNRRVGFWSGRAMSPSSNKQNGSYMNDKTQPMNEDSSLSYNSRRSRVSFGEWDPVEPLCAKSNIIRILFMFFATWVFCLNIVCV